MKGKVGSGNKGLKVLQKASIHSLYWQNQVIALDVLGRSLSIVVCAFALILTPIVINC